MICFYCGEEFTGRAVKEGGQIFCSIACADAAADAGGEEEDEGYYEEDTLEYNSLDEEELY
jgi:hypothetical protein